MQKKTFNTETTAAAELFNAPTAAPAPAKDQTEQKPEAVKPDQITAASKEKEPAPAAKTTATAPAPAGTDEIKQSIPTKGIFAWRAEPDGEKRDRRIQLVSKSSIAQKAACLARTRGYSLAHLFEVLVSEEWDREYPAK